MENKELEKSPKTPKTFLAIGPIVTLLWGNEIINWYLGLF